MPTYELVALPGQTQQSFVLVQPFVPSSTGDKQNLAAFMTDARREITRAYPNAALELPEHLAQADSGKEQFSRHESTPGVGPAQFCAG